MASLKALLGNLDSTTARGITSLYTVLGASSSEFIHLAVDDIAATTGYMLVDLSDTTNWPHIPTGLISLRSIVISIDPDVNFQGDIVFGFLENVDGTNGDLLKILSFHLEKKADPIDIFINFGPFEMDLDADRWFGPTIADDTTWQTDVNLLGPDGNTSFPAGDGDLVCKVIRSAGQVEIGVTVGYETYD